MSVPSFEPKGNYIDGQWVIPSEGTTISSINPADSSQVVMSAPTSPEHALAAASAAHEAAASWAALTPEARLSALDRFAASLANRVDDLADAITLEMGKVRSEAGIEARSLLARVALVRNQQVPRVSTWTAPGVDGECRYRPLGVIGVIGPFNFPLHLIHAHVIPALATGNAVVIKPSERAPLAAQRYVEAWHAAGLPPVLQMVQGAGDVGRALCSAPELGGLAFTGSWPTGHAIEKSLIERPDVLVALEMGGQNMALIDHDADLDQALEGALLGGFLTTGQRCTCTSRVLVHRDLAEPFMDRLVEATRKLTWGDPNTDVFMGPLASVSDRDHVDALCRAGVEAGAEVLLAAERREGGAWRGPSIHRITVDHDSDYTRHEVFGPDLAVTVVDDLDEAIEVASRSDYGLSASVFTASRPSFERAFQGLRVGCLNWNRSTNRASGAFPFGGLGRSGNYRPAGGDAVRYTTYPVQMQWNDLGKLEDQPHVQRALGGTPDKSAQAAQSGLDGLERLHRLEEACEPYALYPAIDANGAASLDVSSLGEAVREALSEALSALGCEVSQDSAAWSLHATLDPTALGDALYSVRSVDPARFLGRRPEGSLVPKGDKLSLPRSEAYRARLLEGDFMPDDKKPPVLDLHRSSGPYLASVDTDPLVLFDPAAQIATHAGGLNPPEILEALHTGAFGETPLMAAPSQPGDHAAIREMSVLLRNAAGGALPYVAFGCSGAQANEMALRVAARLRPQKKRVISFQGAFHGRTMLALHNTWNPAKRERFELDGYRACWITWPAWDHDQAQPTQWEMAGWDEALGSASRQAPVDADALLTSEWDSLISVERAMEDDEALALLVEPMQAEGGERHATSRFVSRLRALATAYRVPFIVDEVQTGFGLGGPFFWHSLFNLPTPPDVVTVAKKAQVGAVLSQTPIGGSDETHVPSVIRGLVQASIIASGDAGEYEARVLPKLRALQAAHPELVGHPRATGYSFGFDLPSKEAVAHIIGQRLWRGYMLYGAGERALRFRLHPHVSDQALDALFKRLDASLELLTSGEVPSWRTIVPPDQARPWPPTRRELPGDIRFETVDAHSWEAVKGQVKELQALCYEPARRDDLGLFGAMLEDPGAVFMLAVQGHGALGEAPLLGTAFALPLELESALDGPAQDPMLGRGNTVYSADVTVHPDHRGRGLGIALKEAQVRSAMLLERPDGSPRYAFMTGRNRVGETPGIQRINERFGAWKVSLHTGQYGEPDGAALYYRIPLGAPRLPAVPEPPKPAVPSLDFASGLSAMFGDSARQSDAYGELARGLRSGALNGGLANKLSLCNFITPSVVRASEWLRALAPRELAHLVIANGRAETVDKGLRAIKFHRGEGAVAIAIGPVWGGESTAASRSLSFAEDHGENHFGWPTTADPCEDMERALSDARQAIERAGAQRTLAMVIEPVYSLTGRAVPDAFWARLRSLADETGVPLVTLENTSAGYRSGRGAFRSSSLPIAVDAMWWYPGGQTGFIFLSDALYVPDKLTLISTWDGDEVSMTRMLWESRLARRLPVGERGARLRQIAEGLGAVDGEGLYLSVRTPDNDGTAGMLLDHGIQVGRAQDGAILLAPPLDISEAELSRLAEAAASVAHNATGRTP